MGASSVDTDTAQSFAISWMWLSASFAEIQSSSMSVCQCPGQSESAGILIFNGVLNAVPFISQRLGFAQPGDGQARSCMGRTATRLRGLVRDLKR
ncbi:hypothetical protein DYH09_10105 [bacterium CPR1]|nr:hypothetical protein [bacterium CPR1]